MASAWTSRLPQLILSQPRCPFTGQAAPFRETSRWERLRGRTLSFNRTAEFVSIGGARSCRRRSGQAGILMVLSLTLLFGVLGLAVDIGWGYFKRQAAQTAADAAALA